MLIVKNPNDASDCNFESNCFLWQKYGERRVPAVVDLSSATDVSVDGILSGLATPSLMNTVDWIANVFTEEQIKAVLIAREPLIKVSRHYGHLMFNMNAYLEHICMILQNYLGENVKIVAPPPPPLDTPRETVYKYLGVLEHCQAIALPYPMLVELSRDPQATFAEKVRMYGLNRAATDPFVTDIPLVGFDF